MIRAIPDLAGLALLGIALAFLLTVKTSAEALHAAFNVGIAGFHPLGGIAAALEHTLIAWCNSAIRSVEKAIAWFFRDLASSLQLFVGLAALVGYGTYKALSYMWNVALPAFVSLQTDAIALVARKAETLATALVGSIASNLAAAKHYAETQAERAFSNAQAYTETKVADAVSALRSEVGADIQAVRDGASDAATTALQIAQSGIAAAENAGRVAVADLRGEIGGELAAIQAGAAAGVSEAERLAQAGVAEAERLAGSALAQSEAAAKQLLAEAEARGKAALTEVGKIAGSIGDDLATIEGNLGALGVAGLIASIPAIATLVHAIATEAGLDSSACRAKNKAICGTDPLQWAGLLAGLAALGLSFDLSDVVKLAAEGVGEAGNLLADAGKIPPDVVQSVGRTIGEVAAAIAA